MVYSKVPSLYSHHYGGNTAKKRCYTLGQMEKITIAIYMSTRLVEYNSKPVRSHIFITGGEDSHHAPMFDDRER